MDKIIITPDCDVYIELKDELTCREELLSLFEQEFLKLEPGWDRDMNDEAYLDWESDILDEVAEKIEDAFDMGIDEVDAVPVFLERLGVQDEIPEKPAV